MSDLFALQEAMQMCSLGKRVPAENVNQEAVQISSLGKRVVFKYKKHRKPCDFYLLKSSQL